MNSKERFIYYSSPEHWFQTALELDSTLKEMYGVRMKYFYIGSYNLDGNEGMSRPFNSRGIYLLMCYSLENLLKGLLVLRNPHFVNKGRLDSSIHTHDLNHLAKLTKFRNNSSQFKLQKYLTDLCLSSARYPIGKNEHQKVTIPIIVDEDFNTYRKLYLKYQTKLVKEFNSNGWESGLSNDKFDTKPGEFKFVINKNYKY